VEGEALTPVLVATIARRAVAVPVQHVVETMRPLPTESGTCMHRGESIAVIDAAALAGANVTPTRCVVLRAGDARVAVLVDSVAEVRRVSAQDVGPPLIESAKLGDVAPAVASVLAQVRALRGPR
jgi:chemotaxis signal transduction protein